MRNTGTLRFIDYFQHVLFSAYPQHLYEYATGVWGCFPPLAYMFYRFIYNLTTVQGVNPSSVTDLLNNDYGLTVFILYSILMIFGVLFAIDLWNEKKNGRLLLLSLLVSSPFFAGAIERGNSVIFIVICLLTALKWRNSRSIIKREVAMLLIAISAGLKIYPAIFGLLYLKERRFKEAIRLIIYGIVFMFGPFIFFNGFTGMKLWIFNIIETMKNDNTGRIEYINGAISSLTYIMTGQTNRYLAAVTTNLFLVLMLFMFIISNNNYRSVFYLCSIMILFPGNMHRYALILFSIPLIMFLMEHGEEKTDDPFVWIETICFGSLFTIPMLWGLLTGFRLRFGLSSYITYVEFWLYTVAYLLVLLVCILECLRVFKYKEYNGELGRQLIHSKEA